MKVLMLTAALLVTQSPFEATPEEERELLLQLWGEPCLSYLLALPGWESRPAEPVESVFLVGKFMPMHRLESGESLPYDRFTPPNGVAEEVLSGRARYKSLTPCRECSAWGNPPGHLDIETLRSYGICTNPQTMQGSIHWKRGLLRRHALVKCGAPLSWNGKGAPPSGLYFGLPDEDSWLKSGALLETVLPLLQELASDAGLELVCVTEELQRRRELAALSE